MTAAALVLAAAYCAGVRRYAGAVPSWRRGARRLGHGRVVAFLAGVAAVAVAISPAVHEAGEHRFWAHMGQHMLLMVVAAPLLAAGAPAVPMQLLLPVAGRRRVATWRWRLRTAPGVRLLYLPLTAWLVSVATLWFWHLPAAFDAAVRIPVLHDLEHATFLLSAWAYWWHVLRAGGRRVRGGVAVLYVFGATLPAAALGAVLTFATHPLYPLQAHQAAASGFDPLVDQQLAGLVMWVPPDVLYLAVSVALFLTWLRPLADAEDTVAPERVTAGWRARSEGRVVTR